MAKTAFCTLKWRNIEQSNSKDYNEIYEFFVRYKVTNYNSWKFSHICIKHVNQNFRFALRIQHLIIANKLLQAIFLLL